MLRLSRCRLRRLPLPSGRVYVRKSSTLVEVDAAGIPMKPTWSVNELLSSYPRPTITAATLNKLHELSALIPPTEGTPQYAKLAIEMEDLVKLVEAVKYVDVSGVGEEGSVPDGRIWASGEGVQLGVESLDGELEAVDGHTLLAHASRTLDGLYVVETDKSRG